MPLRPWQTPGAVLSNPLIHKCCSDMPTQHPKLVLLPTGRHRIHSEEFLTLPPIPTPAIKLLIQPFPSPHALGQGVQGEKSLRRAGKSQPEKFYLIKTLIVLLQTPGQAPLLSFRGAQDGPWTSLKQKQPHSQMKSIKSKNTRSFLGLKRKGDCSKLPVQTSPFPSIFSNFWLFHSPNSPFGHIPTFGSTRRVFAL